jgi:diguanylate cyclase (GGDEF)-like protein
VAKIFYYLIVSLGFGLLIFELINPTSQFEFSMGFLILIILSVYSEFRSVACEDDYDISLSAPIAIFTCVLFPLIMVYLLMLLNAISVKIIVRKYNKDVNFFDEKFFFNFSQFIILCKLGNYFALKLPTDITEVSIGFMLVIPILYLVGNYIFVYAIISLSSKNNAFREINYPNMLWYFYYSIIMVQFMYYGYIAYGSIAIVMMFLFSEPVKALINQKVNEKELFRLKFHDGLTGAFNHTKMLIDISNLDKNRHPFSMFFMDFDDFKKINDSFGHEAGNEVLKHFVSVLETTFPELKVYRYGADEFCLICKNIDQTDEIVKQLETISKSVSLSYDDKLIEYKYTIGYHAFKTRAEMSTSERIKIVDQKMYENKVLKFNE